MDGVTSMEHRAAQQLLLGLVAPRPRTAQVELADAVGHVLAEDVQTRLDHPPFDNSAMDGYAVRSADVTSVPCVLDVVDTSAAGHPSTVRLGPGQAARILTGAVMVSGADAVVPVEHTDAGAEQVEIRRSPSTGANVRRAGEGARRGQVVLRAGTVVHAGHLGLAASSGIDRLTVVRPARVAVVTTGDELVPVGSPLGPGQIHESNSVVVAGLVRSAGAEATLHHSGDDAALLRSLLGELAEDHDVVLTTGGVSMGAEYDAVRVAVRDDPVQVVALDIRPAKPLAFGTLHGALFVGLPGNPVSAVVSFELFVRPALRRLAGVEPAVPPTTTGPAAERFVHPGGPATHFVRVRHDGSGWVSTGTGGSHLIAGIVAADGLAVLSPAQQVEPGEPLEVLPLWT